MSTLIKEIRRQANLSQQEFADQLGVTFATINRWENAKAKPNKMAQTKLYDFCQKENIPVYDITLRKIEKEVKQLAIPENRIVLYHGSKSGIDGKIAPISRTRCDFGKGFYMGTDPLQPLTLICDYERSKFYVVSVSLEGLHQLDVPADLAWAMLVAFNRGKMDNIKGTGLYEKYRRLCLNKDFIIGSIANDRMFYVLDNFFQGNITDLALVKSLSALQLGKQYVAVSQAGCDAVKIEKEISLSYLEKRFLQDISEENRARGVSVANDICKNYRREGTFFDEILDQAKEQ